MSAARYKKASLGTSLLVVIFTNVTACSTGRDAGGEPPTYRDGVAALLDAKCAQCHGTGAASSAAWSVANFATVVSCVTREGREEPVTAHGARAHLLRALDRPDHAGLVTDGERALLRRWVEAGAPSAPPGVHSRAFLDPRSPESHGAVLRARAYAPMRDANDVDACGRCHDGVPSRPASVAFGAPGATSCTTCHTDQGGALACTTCHGTRDRLYPPRDPCFHAPSPGDHAHAVHAGPSASRADGLACAACHPSPASEAPLGGVHANGSVELAFDPAFSLPGDEAAYAPTTGACTGTCHARGGARPAPTWLESAPMRCGDCHETPPRDHYQGACTTCHREANADGTALVRPTKHVDGRVTLGDGSGGCGACHGSGADPWPTSGAHPAHAAPREAKPVACESCHEVPLPGERHPRGSVAGTAAVRLSGLAIAGGHRASFDAATKTCSDTHCHTGAGASAPAPTWAQGASARACGACHASPPPAPHPADPTCATCHPSYAASPRATHVDGFVSH